MTTQTGGLDEAPAASRVLRLHLRQFAVFGITVFHTLITATGLTSDDLSEYH